MDLFSIVCTTCQAKLQVRDKSAIGKILACPKCGSMVMVEAPAHVNVDAPPSGTPAPSLAPAHNSPTQNSPTQNSPTHNSPIPKRDSAPVPAKPGQSPPKRKPRFRGEFPEPAKKAQADAAKHGLLNRESAEAAGVGQAPVLPGEPWESPAAQQLKQIVVLLGAAVIGIALAVGLIALIASWRSQPDQPVASGPATAGEGQEPELSGLASDLDQRTPVDAVTADSSTVPDGPGAVESPPGGAGTTSGEDNPTASEQAGPDSSDLPQLPQVPADLTAADSDTPPGLEPQENPQVDMPADGADLEMSRDEGASTPEVTPPTAGLAPATADSEFVKTQLSTVVIAVEFEDVALADFARFVSDFIAVPVTLDLDSLAARGITANSSLSFQYRGVTVEQMLAAVFEPAGMAFVVEKRQIMVTTAEAAEGTLAEQTYNVADLIESPDDVQSLAKQLTEFVHPSSWNVHGGAGTITAEEYALVVEQWPGVHFQLAMLLDRIRLARGLLPRSDLPVEWITVEPAYERAAEALSESVTVNFSTDTPVKWILEYLNTETDLRILVDWRAAATADWAPDRPSQLVGTDQPLNELLTSWLAPSQLAFRVVDENTIQITSLAALAARPDVEFFRQDSPPKLDVIEQRVRQQLGRETAIPMVYDAPSRCLIVALPQPDQRRVANVLDRPSASQ